MAEARDAIRETQRRLDELDELTAALARAAAEYEPFRAVLANVKRTATDARLAVDDAQRHLDRAPRRDRPRARHHLEVAQESLAAATSDLNGIEQMAGGPRDRHQDLRSRHEDARRYNMHREILDQWGHYGVRAEQLGQVLDALDIWKHWALGHDIPADRLSDSAAVLDDHARRSGHLRIEPVRGAGRSGGR